VISVWAARAKRRAFRLAARRTLSSCPLRNGYPPICLLFAEQPVRSLFGALNVQKHLLEIWLQR